MAICAKGCGKSLAFQVTNAMRTGEMSVGKFGRRMLALFLAFGCLALTTSVAGAQAAKSQSFEKYETHLGPTPVPDGAPTPIVGDGAVSAVLKGQTLEIDGRFAVKDATVTGAKLMRGVGIGLPGAMVPAADIAANGDGTLRASIKLSRDQLAALRAGSLFVLITSSKSPAPVGHLWGWLLPAQPAVAQGVPQIGDWYLPQGAGLKARSAQRSSR